MFSWAVYFTCAVKMYRFVCMASQTYSPPGDRIDLGEGERRGRGAAVEVWVKYKRSSSPSLALWRMRSLIYEGHIPTFIHIPLGINNAPYCESWIATRPPNLFTYFLSFVLLLPLEKPTLNLTLIIIWSIWLEVKEGKFHRIVSSLTITHISRIKRHQVLQITSSSVTSRVKIECSRFAHLHDWTEHLWAII